MNLPSRAVTRLQACVRKYLPLTSVPAPGRWARLDHEALWRHFVMQVVVVGASAPASTMASQWNSSLGIELAALAALSPGGRARAVNGVLRRYGVRYASTSLKKCRKSQAICANYAVLATFPGGPHGYVSFLSSLPDEASRIRRLARDMKFIKLKGARDLLADLGLVTEIVAFDARVLRILQAAGVKPPKSLVTSPRSYAALEASLLAHVAHPLGITGVAMDRVLYQNAPAILSDLASKNPSSRLAHPPHPRRPTSTRA